jgi:hypothetical protein
MVQNTAAVVQQQFSDVADPQGVNGDDRLDTIMYMVLDAVERDRFDGLKLMERAMVGIAAAYGRRTGNQRLEDIMARITTAAIN